MSAVRAFVAARAWASPEGPTRLFERAAGWLRERKVLLPGVSVLARLVSEVRVEQAERLYGEPVAAVPVATAARLEALLTVGAGARVSDLERLRSGPRQVAVSEVVRQLERLTVLRDFGLSAIEQSTLSAGRVQALARHGLAADASALRDLAPGRRLATLIATVRSLTFQAADDVGDALHALVAERIIRRATREAVPAQRRSFGRLSDVSLELAAAFDVVLEALADESLTDESFRRRLRDGLDVAAITRTLGVVRAVAAPDGDDDSVAAEMLRRFLTVRAFAPLVAERLPLGATTGGAPILAALRSLPRLLTAGRVTRADIDPDVLSGSWHRLVFANHGVDERAYAVAVTEALHRAMRRRDVFVVDGRRWGDPRARLLDDDAWSHVKGDVLTGLELPGEPGGHLDRLVERLDTAYRTVADELGDNTAVRGRGRIGTESPVSVVGVGVGGRCGWSVGRGSGRRG